MEPEGSLLCSQEPRADTYPELDESSPPSHHLSQRSILILSFHLHLGLPSGVFLSGSPTNIFCVFLIPTMCAASPAHIILPHLITLIMFIEEYKL
jgi:hypothetical protein